MIINNSINFLNAKRHNNIVNRSLDKTTKKLASGKRINSASDDVAGLTISEGMRSQISQYNTEITNELDYYSKNQYLDGVSASVQDQVQRLKTLATQAANGTLSDDDRKLIQIEIDEIKKSIQDTAENSEFNKQKVATHLSLDNLNIADLDVSTQDGANAALSKLDDAIDYVSGHRAKTGAKMNRSEHRINSLQVASENTQAAESTIRDTDYATEVINQVRDEVLLKASEASMAHSLSLIENINKLL